MFPSRQPENAGREGSNSEFLLRRPEPPFHFSLTLKKLDSVGRPFWVAHTTDVSIPDAKLQEIVSLEKDFKAVSVNGTPLAGLSSEARKMTLAEVNLTTITFVPEEVGVPWHTEQSAGSQTNADKMAGMQKRDLEKKIMEHVSEIRRLQGVINTLPAK